MTTTKWANYGSDRPISSLIDIDVIILFNAKVSAQANVHVVDRSELGHSSVLQRQDSRRRLRVLHQGRSRQRGAPAAVVGPLPRLPVLQPAVVENQEAEVGLGFDRNRRKKPC